MRSGIDSPAGFRLPRRQLVLLVVALIVPCLVLVVLSLRMLAQERELAAKRLDDERRQIVAAVRQELLVRLESVKLRVAAGASRDSVIAPDVDDHVALAGVIENGRLILPWERSRSADEFRRALEETPFAVHLGTGEREELALRRPAAAVEAYRAALAVARRPAQRAYAELLLARALAKLQQSRDMRVALRRVAQRQPAVTDEHGVPLSLYGAERLLDAASGDAAVIGEVLETIRSVLASVRWLPPAGCYLVETITDQSARAAGGGPLRDTSRQLLDAARHRVREVEQALALQRATAAILAYFPSVSDPVWVPFSGAEIWLVGLAGAANGAVRLVTVRAEPVFVSLDTVRACRASGRCVVRLAAGPRDGGELAGPSLPGLKIAYTPTASAASGGLSRSFYIAALVLVLMVTLLGGLVLWHDMRRELRLAELRSQFVSSVSHELKTPLTAIRMFAETLRMGRVQDEATRGEYLDTIVSESERLTRLLNNVLDFSRIEQGRKVYHLGPHALADTVRAAARAMQYPLAQQGQELRVRIDELPLVRIDPDAIEQAVLNLLTNAMKYSGDGREIDLRLAREDGHAVVAVMDRGVGIPLNEQERIFDKFYRVQTPENRRIPGTGLGLTLVQHIARAHGGFVTVASAPGEGSTFSIHLPLDPETSKVPQGGARLQPCEPASQG